MSGTLLVAITTHKFYMERTPTSKEMNSEPRHSQRPSSAGVMGKTCGALVSSSDQSTCPVVS